MARIVWVQAAVDLEFDEEVFPLGAEVVCHIVPKSLDSGVVNTSKTKSVSLDL